MDSLVLDADARHSDTVRYMDASSVVFSSMLLCLFLLTILTHKERGCCSSHVCFLPNESSSREVLLSKCLCGEGGLVDPNL